MSDTKTSSDDKKAEHDARTGRIRDKHKHKDEDHNHMAQHFVSMERKLKETEERCALRERTLAENRKTIQDAESQLDLLIAQKEVMKAVKTAIDKNCAESARQSAEVKKKRKVGSEAQQKKFVRGKVECVLDANRVFDEEITTFLDALSDLNARMRAD